MKRGDLVLPLKRKNAFDEDDTAIFSGHLMTPVERKIVIKVNKVEWAVTSVLFRLVLRTDQEHRRRP